MAMLVTLLPISDDGAILAWDQQPAHSGWSRVYTKLVYFTVDMLSRFVMQLMVGVVILDCKVTQSRCFHVQGIGDSFIESCCPHSRLTSRRFILYKVGRGLVAPCCGVTPSPLHLISWSLAQW